MLQYNLDLEVEGFTLPLATSIRDQVSDVCGSPNANGYWHDVGANFTFGFDNVGYDYCPDLTNPSNS